jgi:hypothetical protein
MADQRLDAEINLRTIVGFGIVLVAVTVVVTALMWWLSLGLRAHVASDDPAPPALPEARIQEGPPGPRLQSDPIGDLRRMRAEEDTVLNEAAWVDEAAGVASLPIDLAIDAVSEKGALPSMSSPEEAPAEGL